MKLNSFPYYKRLAAVILSGSIGVTSVPVSSAVPVAPPLIQKLGIPERLGSVTHWNLPEGGKRPLVIFIQDLHLHYPTQTRILKILELLKSEGLLNGFIGVEGYEGPADFSALEKVSPEVRQKTVDYFMKKGTLSGDEAYAILHPEEPGLFGIEKLDLYEAHRQLVQDSAKSRRSLLSEVRILQKQLIEVKKKDFPRSLRQRDSEEFANLPDEIAQLQDKARVAMSLEPGSRAASIYGILQTEFALTLISRLLNQELLEDEAAYVQTRIPALAHLLHRLLASLSARNMSQAEIEALFRSSLNFYTLALERNQPMADRTLALLSAQGSSVFPTQVIVAGGFHTAGVTRALQKKGIGFVVITPEVDHYTDADQARYMEHLLGRTITTDEIKHDLTPQALRVRTPLVSQPLLWKTAASLLGLAGVPATGWAQTARKAAPVVQEVWNSPSTWSSATWSLVGVGVFCAVVFVCALYAYHELNQFLVHGDAVKGWIHPNVYAEFPSLSNLDTRNDIVKTNLIFQLKALEAFRSPYPSDEPRFRPQANQKMMPPFVAELGGVTREEFLAIFLARLIRAEQNQAGKLWMPTDDVPIYLHDIPDMPLVFCARDKDQAGMFISIDYLESLLYLFTGNASDRERAQRLRSGELQSLSDQLGRVKSKQAELTGIAQEQTAQYEESKEWLTERWEAFMAASQSAEGQSNEPLGALKDELMVSHAELASRYQDLSQIDTPTRVKLTAYVTLVALIDMKLSGEFFEWTARIHMYESLLERWHLQIADMRKMIHQLDAQVADLRARQEQLAAHRVQQALVPSSFSSGSISEILAATVPHAAFDLQWTRGGGAWMRLKRRWANAWRASEDMRRIGNRVLQTSTYAGMENVLASRLIDAQHARSLAGLAPLRDYLFSLDAEYKRQCDLRSARDQSLLDVKPQDPVDLPDGLTYETYASGEDVMSAGASQAATSIMMGLRSAAVEIRNVCVVLPADAAFLKELGTELRARLQDAKTVNLDRLHIYFIGQIDGSDSIEQIAAGLREQLPASQPLHLHVLPSHATEEQARQFDQTLRTLTQNLGNPNGTYFDLVVLDTNPASDFSFYKRWTPFSSKSGMADLSRVSKREYGLLQTAPANGALFAWLKFQWGRLSWRRRKAQTISLLGLNWLRRSSAFVVLGTKTEALWKLRELFPANQQTPPSPNEANPLTICVNRPVRLLLLRQMADQLALPIQIPKKPDLGSHTSDPSIKVLLPPVTIGIRIGSTLQVELAGRDGPLPSTPYRLELTREKLGADLKSEDDVAGAIADAVLSLLEQHGVAANQIQGLFCTLSNALLDEHDGYVFGEDTVLPIDWNLEKALRKAFHSRSALGKQLAKKQMPYRMMGAGVAATFGEFHDVTVQDLPNPGFVISWSETGIDAAVLELSSEEKTRRSRELAEAGTEALVLTTEDPGAPMQGIVRPQEIDLGDLIRSNGVESFWKGEQTVDATRIKSFRDWVAYPELQYLIYEYHQTASALFEMDTILGLLARKFGCTPELLANGIAMMIGSDHPSSTAWAHHVDPNLLQIIRNYMDKKASATEVDPDLFAFKQAMYRTWWSALQVLEEKYGARYTVHLTGPLFQQMSAGDRELFLRLRPSLMRLDVEITNQAGNVELWGAPAFSLTERENAEVAAHLSGLGPAAVVPGLNASAGLALLPATASSGLSSTRLLGAGTVEAEQPSLRGYWWNRLAGWLYAGWQSIVPSETGGPEAIEVLDGERPDSTALQGQVSSAFFIEKLKEILLKVEFLERLYVKHVHRLLTQAEESEFQRVHQRALIQRIKKSISKRKQFNLGISAGGMTKEEFNAFIKQLDKEIGHEKLFLVRVFFDSGIPQADRVEMKKFRGLETYSWDRVTVTQWGGLSVGVVGIDDVDDPRLALSSGSNEFWITARGGDAAEKLKRYVEPSSKNDRLSVRWKLPPKNIRFFADSAASTLLRKPRGNDATPPAAAGALFMPFGLKGHSFADSIAFSPSSKVIVLAVGLVILSAWVLAPLTRYLRERAYRQRVVERWHEFMQNFSWMPDNQIFPTVSFPMVSPVDLGVIGVVPPRPTLARAA